MTIPGRVVVTAQASKSRCRVTKGASSCDGAVTMRPSTALCRDPVERSFAWMARCRRLARDYERLPETLAGLHVVACVVLMLRRAADLASAHNNL